jgi:uncharacterized heparinase superfamily protein
MDPLVFLRTVRHLQPIQIGSRISIQTRRRLLQRCEFLARRYEAKVGAYDELTSLPFPPIEQSWKLDGIEQGFFTFLNQRVALGSPVDWDPEGVDRLWLYQLHSFNYLLPLGSRFYDEESDTDYRLFRNLCEEWMRTQPIGATPAWDPYPTSLRIRNWLRAQALFEEALRDDLFFARAWLESLYSQAIYLEDFLEYHLLGNHLIENGRALLLAGLFFKDARARRWRSKGERILWRELERQFLDDGGHDERSPMYHQLMLAVYQEVLSVLTGLDIPVATDVHRRVEAMENWLATMLHPDGEIALLNDSVFDMAGPAAPLLGRNFDLAEGMTPLPQSGYFVFRDSERQTFAVFDGGHLGPDHQPGHGHCDCLSYELSISGLRLIVDSGVGTYYGQPTWRNYYRSTRAHNTVQVDGEEQSEIWHRFRVARMAYPSRVRWGSNDHVEWVTASHTGYRRLPGKVTHRRWFCWIDRKYWLILDRFTGSGRHRFESFLHFHPDADVSSPIGHDGLFEGVVRRQDAILRALIWGGQEAHLVRGEAGKRQGWYAPSFNRHLESSVWEIRAEGSLPACLGYVLWPGSESVSSRFSAPPGDPLQVEIDTKHKQYLVSCDEATVEAIQR